jgi:hypothetical protein
MIILWRGYGYLVAVIPFCIATFLGLFFGKYSSFAEDLGTMIGVFISSVIIWVLGRKLNTTNNRRTIIDMKTGEKFLLHQEHSLFNIRMEYWAFLVGAYGVMMLVDMLLHGKSTF